MSVIPLAFNGEGVRALVIGGGRVGTRRALSLLDAGARVRVIAPVISPDLDARTNGESSARLSIDRREYAGPQDIGDATLVVAATESRAVNERIASDANAALRPVNVADAPDRGSFIFPAVHRAGPIAIGVSAGNVPNAAGRIRDAIADRIDARYANAVMECSALRQEILATTGSDKWREVATEMIDDRFCESIENGTFAERTARWR